MSSRVMEARFDGKCAICSLPTLAGMRIAKTPAGWAHESCASGGEPPKAVLAPEEVVRSRVNYIYVVDLREGKIRGHLRRSGKISLLSRNEYASGERGLALARRLDPEAFSSPTPEGMVLTFGNWAFVACAEEVR